MSKSLLSSVELFLTILQTLVLQNLFSFLWRSLRIPHFSQNHLGPQGERLKGNMNWPWFHNSLEIRTNLLNNILEWQVSAKVDTTTLNGFEEWHLYQAWTRWRPQGVTAFQRLLHHGSCHQPSTQSGWRGMTSPFSLQHY